MCTIKRRFISFLLLLTILLCITGCTNAELGRVLYAVLNQHVIVSTLDSPKDEVLGLKEIFSSEKFNFALYNNPNYSALQEAVGTVCQIGDVNGVIVETYTQTFIVQVDDAATVDLSSLVHSLVSTYDGTIGWVRGVTSTHRLVCVYI